MAASDATSFSLSERLTHFRPVSGRTWNDEFRDAPGGAFGKVVQAIWLAPHGNGQEVALKLIRGKHPSGVEGGMSREDFQKEATTLLRVRLASSARSTDSGATDDPVAHTVGHSHLLITHCLGEEADAHTLLPDHAAPGTPLFIIAMEQLEGGTLWGLLRVRPLAPPGQVSILVGTALPPETLLAAAADLAAALAALHACGYSHGDIK
jgi:serine/threonine protein kinase